MCLLIIFGEDLDPCIIVYFVMDLVMEKSGLLSGRWKILKNMHVVKLRVKNTNALALISSEMYIMPLGTAATEVMTLISTTVTTGLKHFVLNSTGPYRAILIVLVVSRGIQSCTVSE